jgi:hypothetical protein
MTLYKELRHINTKEGYFDHFYYFTTVMPNFKDAYEVTEMILRNNFFRPRYKDYDAFRKGKVRYQRTAQIK